MQDTDGNETLGTLGSTELMTVVVRCAAQNYLGDFSDFAEFEVSVFSFSHHLNAF